MAQLEKDPRDVYTRLGVRPIINASGSVTRYGGTRTHPEALEVMADAASVLVEMGELNHWAGEIIAGITGAEAGFVCSGAAGGLVLQAAACIAGGDPVKMKRLPDTQGMKNEIIIQTMHRFPYDQCYRAPGGVLVEIGDAKRCYSWELEGAINERTAAVAYLFAPFTNRRSIPFEQVCRIAHERDVPVIVDAASMLPPRENLYRYLRQGADMVIYSGGKGVRGPQASGILCGRKDLIEAASANANPNQFFGRSMKVAKEEIVGLLTALELFVVEDEDAETRRYEEMSRRVVDSLTEGAWPGAHPPPRRLRLPDTPRGHEVHQGLARPFPGPRGGVPGARRPTSLPPSARRPRPACRGPHEPHRRRAGDRDSPAEGRAATVTC